MKTNNCRACGFGNIEQFLDMGSQPFANALLSSRKEFAGEKKYPLSLNYCHNCSLVQLDYTADPNALFENYPWVTGAAATTMEYSETFCKRALNRQRTDGYILEIASNDGTFLNAFKNRGYNVLGIDPAKNIAEIAQSRGIKTLADFFSKNTADKILSDYGSPSIIIARNVLPHVADIHDFVSGLAALMNNSNVLILEVHYAGIILDELHYDSVYHEHLCYFTAKSLESLLDRYGFFTFDVEKSPISGGSIVLYIKNRKQKETDALQKLREKEEASRYNCFETWASFAKKTAEHKILLNNLLDAENTKKICAYGASARSSTMLNYCDINSIEFIADQNSLKHNKFTPGSHMLIVSPEEMLEHKPDIILLTAWNFKDELIGNLNIHGYKGGVILPLPYQPRIERIQ